MHSSQVTFGFFILPPLGTPRRQLTQKRRLLLLVHYGASICAVIREYLVDSLLHVCGILIALGKTMCSAASTLNVGN